MAVDDMRKRALGALTKAVERVLADEQRAAKVAKAVGTVQKGRDILEQAQENVMRAVGIATRRDYKDVSKRISALKRRVRHLAERLDGKKPA